MSRTRTLFATLALACAALPLAAQAGPYEARIRGNVGVGLGTRLWGNIGDGLACQVLAATTNGCCGNQTFAVTSGTLGAKQPGDVAKNELTDYLHDNMDTTARAIASGRGEAMDAVLDILAVPAERRESVASHLQASFSSIYTSQNVTHDVVAQRILAVIAA